MLAISDSSHSYWKIHGYIVEELLHYPHFRCNAGPLRPKHDHSFARGFHPRQSASSTQEIQPTIQGCITPRHLQTQVEIRHCKGAPAEACPMSADEIWRCGPIFRRGMIRLEAGSWSACLFKVSLAAAAQVVLEPNV